MSSKIPLTFLALAILAVTPVAAQLAPPNAAGDSIGHVHLNVKDIAAHQRFWTQVGGKPVTNGKLVMMQFPGIYVILRQQDSTGGSAGTIVNHFGLHVKNLDEWMPKWKAAGLTIEPGNNPKQLYLIAPDEVRLEIIEDTSIPTPVAMHHIHLWVQDTKAAQDWYVKNFGAVAGKRANFDTANVPGAEITFAKQDKAQAPTKGRSIDHIGFEVSNIDAFIKKLEGAGIPIETTIRPSANAPNLRIAYVMDPWGTYIEITEGLRKSPSASN